jgi:multidrug efflux pump subunit AcrB
MRLTHFFIDRPRFAVVLSTFVTLLGLGALAELPVAQYPEVVPPTVQVTTSYPGASAQTVARTVATPLEQQINGVENMIYMSSQSTGDGNLTITVTSVSEPTSTSPKCSPKIGCRMRFHDCRRMSSASVSR